MFNFGKSTAKKNHQPSPPLTQMERRNARLVATYGITELQYEHMVTSQNGLCAICHRAPAPGRLLVVDHNHDTGVVRGLLCTECNTGIGLLGDSPTTLVAAANYLEHVGDYPRDGTPQPGTKAFVVKQSHLDLKEAPRAAR